MYKIIFNPESRSNRGISVWDTVEQILYDKEIHYLLYRTTHAGHAEELVRDITSDGLEHTFIVIGGDGTLNEVLNGISHPDLVTVGLIPSGSGNDFARAMNIPLDPAEALELILSTDKPTPINYGDVFLPNSRRRFLISCGCGFDSDVCKDAQISPFKPILNRLHMGKLIYTLVALKKLIRKSVFSAAMKLDGTVVSQMDNIFFLTAMNTIYEGGGYMFCPDATPTDDKLDFLMVNNLPRRQIIPLLPKAKKGRHIGHKGIDIKPVTSVSLKFSKSVYLHTDGEVFGKYDHVKISCGREHLRFCLGDTQSTDNYNEKAEKDNE